MLRVGTVVMGVQDLARAVQFWSDALDYEPKRQLRPDDDFMILVPISGEGAHLAFDVTDSTAPEFPSVHLDLFAGGAEDQTNEVERLVSLGASRVDWPHYPAESDFIVLADTEGNRFCVIDTEFEAH